MPDKQEQGRRWRPSPRGRALVAPPVSDRLLHPSKGRREPPPGIRPACNKASKRTRGRAAALERALANDRKRTRTSAGRAQVMVLRQKDVSHSFRDIDHGVIKPGSLRCHGRMGVKVACWPTPFRM